MARNLYLVFVTQLFITEAISSYPRYYIQQQQSPRHQPFPCYKQYYQPNYPNYSYPKPKVSQPIPRLPPPQSPQPIPRDCSPSVKSEKCLTKGPEKIESNVLNNLAIALQLLIVSNIINNPPKETNVLPASETILELAQKHFPSQTPGCPCEVNYQMPNAQFLGSSNFGDDGMLTTMAGNLGPMGSKIPVPRSSFGLISPYDALTNSARSESLASSFRSPNDFLNPYAAISATDNYKDLFSLDF